ncbi:MAG: putative sigma-54 modulation protein [Myxococcota bacterium]|jgi:putative sigma-54 modulation protein
MGLDVTFRGLEPTKQLRERAEEKFAKITRHLNEPIEAHLICLKEKHRLRAELTVHSAGDVLKVREEGADMFSSIDGSMNRLARAAKRLKERRLNRRGPMTVTDGFTVPDPE